MRGRRIALVYVDPLPFPSCSSESSSTHADDCAAWLMTSVIGVADALLKLPSALLTSTLHIASLRVRRSVWSGGTGQFLLLCPHQENMIWLFLLFELKLTKNC